MGASRVSDPASWQTRRLVIASSLGTAFVVVFLSFTWGTMAPDPDDPSDDKVKHWKGGPVDITPQPGRGDVSLRDKNGWLLGNLPEGEHALAVGCHLKDPKMVLVRREVADQGKKPDPFMGYVRYTEDKLKAGTVIPCGG